MNQLTTLILAAGKGTRMKSDLPKVLHKLNGRPLISHVISQARKIHSDRIIAIIGHKKDLVISELSDEHIEFAIQEQQLGTGHAVLMAEANLEGWDGDLLILSGDVPLLSAETLARLLETHRGSGSDATVLTTELEDPFGYGRIVRRADGTLDRIVEEKDADDAIRQIKEINSGIYVFKKELLFLKLRSVGNNNSQKEYYLPDVLPMMIKENRKVSVFMSENAAEIQGVNTVEQLRAMEILMGENP